MRQYSIKKTIDSDITGKYLDALEELRDSSINIRTTFIFFLFSFFNGLLGAVETFGLIEEFRKLILTTPISWCLAFKRAKKNLKR
jgi:hypothetical protein